jgi:hypothetical protein
MKCKISNWSCVYHACMSDDCQKYEVLKHNDYGNGKCETMAPLEINADAVLEDLKDKELFELKDKLDKVSDEFFSRDITEKGQILEQNEN